MKTISLKISLEPYKTRLPLIFPAYIDGQIANVVSGSTIENRQNGNYGGFPLNLSPKVMGRRLSDFTPEMAEKYGDYEKIFSYFELLAMFNFFEKYNSYKYANNTVYADMQDYLDNQASLDGLDVDGFLEMDRQYKEYGGEKFYNWLRNYYFGIIDFVSEYDKLPNNQKEISRTEWLRCVDRLPATMYYVDAYEFYQEISVMHDKFGNLDSITKCTTQEDCCDCADYFKWGGNTLYNILTNWIEDIGQNLQHINYFIDDVQDDDVPCLSIPVNLEAKIGDFGNFSIFSKDWVAGEEYNIGNVCTYNDDVYVLTSGKGYVIDQTTEIPVFDTAGWTKYIEVYKRKSKESGLDVNDLDSYYEISGRTTSTLEEFSECSYDAMGNILPGRFTPEIKTSGSTCVHPIENTILELPYKIGTVINMERLDSTQYRGDILYAAHFYPCDSLGNRIVSGSYDCYAGDAVNEAIDKAVRDAHNLNVWNETVGVDFEYYKGAVLTYSHGKFELKKINFETDTNDEVLRGKPLGIKCIDKCVLRLKNTMYELSYCESYPIQYYDVEYDTESKYSDTYDKVVTHKMSNFYFWPKCYEDNYNQLIAAPLIRKDETLGFSGPEKVVDNIYIDRGYATVLDRHLKVCEVKSLDDLARYGNGSFKMIDIEKDNG